MNVLEKGSYWKFLTEYNWPVLRTSMGQSVRPQFFEFGEIVVSFSTCIISVGIGSLCHFHGAISMPELLWVTMTLRACLRPTQQVWKSAFAFRETSRLGCFDGIFPIVGLELLKIFCIIKSWCIQLIKKIFKLYKSYREHIKKWESLKSEYEIFENRFVTDPF